MRAILEDTEQPPDEEQAVPSPPSGPRPPRISLEEMRRRRMMTQADLAKAAGLNVTTIRDIERGKATARFRTIQKLCAALHCQPDEIEWPGDPLRLDPGPEPTAPTD